MRLDGKFKKNYDESLFLSNPTTFIQYKDMPLSLSRMQKVLQKFH
jgi:hypothetical protein